MIPHPTIIFASLALLVAIPTTVSGSSRVLTCTVNGASMVGQRVVHLTIVPPKDNERYNLWALTDEHQPGLLIREAVGVGTVQVDYGAHEECQDLIFLNIGDEKGSSHIAFWLMEGVYRHPNFIVIDLWKPDIPIRLMETVEPQPYLAGNCE